MSTPYQYEQNIVEAAQYVKDHLLGGSEADVFVVLGSGLGGYANTFTEKKELPYGEIPHTPEVGVAGHAGKLVYTNLHGKKVVCAAGRFHSYEGYTGDIVSFLPRLAEAIGCTIYVLTNAAGGAGETWSPGCGMVIRDHINMCKWNPLRETMNHPAICTEKGMSEDSIYSERLSKIAHEVATEINFNLHDGVYAWMSGPTYETPAEIDALRHLGVSAFGMSSVPEAQAAHEAGLEVFGMTLVTNMAAGMGHEELTHEEVSLIANMASNAVQTIIDEVVKRAELPSKEKATKTSFTEDQLALAKEDPIPLPECELASESDIEADVATLKNAGLNKVDAVMFSYERNVEAKHVANIHDLKSIKAVSSAARTGSIAVATIAEKQVMVINLTNIEGFLPSESSSIIRIADALGAHGVVFSAPVMTLAEDVKSTTAVTSEIFNHVADCFYPLHTTTTERASVNVESNETVALANGPSLPSTYTRSFLRSMGCDTVTIAGAYPVIHAQSMKMPVVIITFTESAGCTKCLVEDVVAKFSHVEAGKFVMPNMPEESYALFRPAIPAYKRAVEAAETIKSAFGLKDESISCMHVYSCQVDGLNVEGYTAVEAECVIPGTQKVLCFKNTTSAIVVFVADPVTLSGYSNETIQICIRAAQVLKAVKFIFSVRALGDAKTVAVDQINLTGENLLRGHNVEEYGVRFPDCTCMYKPELRKAIIDAVPEATESRFYLTMAPCYAIGNTEKKAIAGPLACNTIVPFGGLLPAVCARHSNLLTAAVSNFSVEDLAKIATL